MGLRVGLGTVLAVGAAVLAIDLADEAYGRIDLSVTGRNTLDPEIVDLIEQLPEPVVADLFTRTLPPPYDQVSNEVTVRLYEILRVAMESRRDKFQVRLHDPSDFEATRRRQTELGVDGIDFVVFSNESGTRKSRSNLYGDVAVVDWGLPTLAGFEMLQQAGIRDVTNVARRPADARPAQVGSFRGEEVLLTSLLKVSSGSSPRIYFSTGQGEPSLEDAEGGGLAGLARVLEEDDFEVLTWNPAKTPEVPADAVALALIGPNQPFPPGTLDAIRAWVKQGGRLVAAPSLESVERAATGGVVELLTSYGMVPLPGLVCEPLRDAMGRAVAGDSRCALLRVSDEGMSASSPLTEPLRRRARSLDFAFMSAFRRGGYVGGSLLELVVSSRESWRDLAVQPGQYNYLRDRGETPERLNLIMYLELASGQKREGGEVKKGHVLGIGNAGFLSNSLIETNKDFLVNAFNWMDEDRNYRIRVSPLPRPESRLDLARSSALPVLTWTLYLGFPGLCLSVGLFLAWRRRS